MAESGVSSELIDGIKAYGAGWASAVEETRWSLGEYYLSLYHQLRSRFPKLRSGPLAVGVTGAEAGCGASITAAGLARAATEASQKPVLLMDANVRRPSVSKRFHLGSCPGLTDLLLGKVELAECVHTTGVNRLDAMTVGQAHRLTIPPDALGLLLAELKKQYEIIVLDLPVPGDPDACGPLAAVLNGLLLVLEPGRVQRDRARSLCQRLEENGAQLLGVVLNNS